MKAKMKNNLIKRYKAIMPKEYDAEIGEFLESVEGKSVNLIFIGDDAFEAKNNDIWLPNVLWDKA